MTRPSPSSRPPSLRPPSLRRDLVRSLLGPMLLAVALTVAGAVIAIYHEVQEVYDSTLVQYARLVAETVPPENADADEKTDTATAYKYERKIGYRILEGGALTAKSFNAPDLDDQGLQPGFTNRRIAGKPWRVFVLEDEASGRRVEVAERYAVRHEIAFQLLLSLSIPALLFALMALGVLWLGTTRGLSRLSALSGQIDRRAADDISAIESAEVPQEVRPLLDALNRLFARTGESFARERQFTDNAAHELRTPLAAIKTQAQVIARTETLSAEGGRQLENLLAAVDRGAALTASLLSFARLQNDHAPMQPQDLARLTAVELRALAPEAAARGLRIGADIQDGATVDGAEAALSILVRNILQNAIKFTPAGGAVAVTLAEDGGFVDFSVRDTGPGIPASLRVRVFDRFFRADKAAAPGAGLGLAMVKWIADSHRAQISLEENAPSGLVFRVRFPKAAAPAKS